MKLKLRSKFLKIFLVASILSIAIMFTACGKKKKDNLNNISENLSNYYIDLEYQPTSQSAIANCELDYINNSDAMLKEIKLHLYIASFCKDAKNPPLTDTNHETAYYGEESYATLNISRVKLNEKDILPTYEGEDNDILVVNLSQSLYPSERVNLKIEYNFSLPHMKHRFGYGENTVNFGNFYPIACAYDNGWKTDPYSAIGDPFCSDSSNYFVSLSIPENYTLASTGEIKNMTETDGKSYYNLEAKCVRDFAFVLSDKFNVATKKYNDITINYFYTLDNNYQKALDCSYDAIKTFSEQFFYYPYSTYNVVQADFCYGGMEYPNLSLIANDIENYDDYLNVIVHETAHQWWYGLVGNDEFNEAWLDESLTEFSTVLFYDYNTKYAFNHKQMVDATHENYCLYQTVYTDVLGSLDSSMNRANNEFSTEPEYTFNVYAKGVLMFDSLYNLVGKKNFITSLKHYAENNKYKIAKCENLIASFETISKTNLENFLSCWLDGKVIIH